MAGILAGLLSITLAEVGKAAGLAVVSAGVTNVFNLITGTGGGGPDPEVKQKLDAIARDLKKVGDDVKEIDKSIANTQLGIKTDLVQTYITSINALFDQYMGALAALTSAAAEKTDQLSRERQRVIELGGRVSNETYGHLQQFHTFVAGQDKSSLLYLSNLISLRDSKDFVIHFVKMKTLLIMFYMVQRKGLQLLEYAHADPKVNFTDGQSLIANVNANIVAQEAFWNKMITAPVIELASQFTRDPSGKISIDLYGGGKRGIHTGNEYTNAYFMGDQPCQWILEPIQKIDVSNLTADNFWRLREAANGKVMYVSGSGYVVVRNDFGPTNDDMSRWNLRCTEAGLFQVKYSGAKYSGNSFDQWKLKAIVWDGVSKLTAEPNVPDSESASHFTIALWKA